MLPSMPPYLDPQAQLDEQARREHDAFYGAEWRRARLQCLRRARWLCQRCEAQGRLVPARQVDHIIPREEGGTHAQSNLQALCIPCHADKTAAEQGKERKPVTGADGWPVG